MNRSDFLKRASSSETGINNAVVGHLKPARRRFSGKKSLRNINLKGSKHSYIDVPCANSPE